MPHVLYYEILLTYDLCLYIPTNVLCLCQNCHCRKIMLLVIKLSVVNDLIIKLLLEFNFDLNAMSHFWHEYVTLHFIIFGTFNIHPIIMIEYMQVFCKWESGWLSFILCWWVNKQIEYLATWLLGRYLSVLCTYFWWIVFV